MLGHFVSLQIICFSSSLATVISSWWKVLLIVKNATNNCEHGFSKQNWVKSDCKIKLKLQTLDALM
jgi:hypothetical protein